jgi:predicted acetyltransferase
MDGIGGVGTDEGRRMQGYGRRVMEAAVRHMVAGDAALTMLYGIPEFYDRFGYVPAGPEHLIHMAAPAGDAAPGLPGGWVARPAEMGDIARLEALYESQTAEAVGAGIRTDRSYSTRRMREAASNKDERLAVVVGPNARIRGYAWHGGGFWASDVLERDFPEAWVVSEALAADSEAADAVLALCLQRAGARHTGALIAAPPEGLIASSAQRLGATFERRYQRSGGSMARILSLDRLFGAIAPELRRRTRAAGLRMTRPLRIATEYGSVTVAGGSEKPPAPSGVEGPESDAISIPASELARAVLGACPPEDVLSRTATPRVPPRLRMLFAALFPQRSPHMYVPDRY